MNTVLADGPRQVVNAITLYSVAKMDLLPGGENAVEEDKPEILQFFDNIKILADENNLRALVLAGMVFTVVIWVLSMIKLIIAIILYLLFLFHHIPAQDGTLKAYCHRKINTRLKRIVRTKVNKALAKGVVLQDRTPTNPNMGADRKPTLPVFGDDDKTPIVSTLSRTTTEATMTTLPAYTSRPGTAAPRERQPTLPDVATFPEKPSLSRTVTESSAYSDPTSAPAVSAYSPLDRGGSPAPPIPPLPDNASFAPTRNQTPVSRSNFSPGPYNTRGPPSRMGSAGGTRDPRERRDPYSPEGYGNPSSGSPFRAYGAPVDPYSRALTPIASVASGDSGSMQSYTPNAYNTRYNSRPAPRPANPPRSFTPGSEAMNPGSPVYPNNEQPVRTFSPVSSRAPSRAQGGYTPYNASARNVATTPFEAGQDTVNNYSGRSGTQNTYTSPAYNPQPPRGPDYY